MAQEAKYGTVIVEGKDIPSDEPLFIIRGQDRAAVDAIEQYARMALAHGASDVFVNEVRANKELFRSWQDAHPDRVKVPD